MAQLGRLRFKEVGGLVFGQTGDPSKIGLTYEYRTMQGRTTEIFSCFPWRTYQHYQREKEGRMSYQINALEKCDRRVILMAFRSMPDFMYGYGTYLAHPDFSLQNILVDARTSQASSTGTTHGHEVAAWAMRPFPCGSHKTGILRSTLRAIRVTQVWTGFGRFNLDQTTCTGGGSTTLLYFCVSGEKILKVKISMCESTHSRTSCTPLIMRCSVRVAVSRLCASC